MTKVTEKLAAASPAHAFLGAMAAVPSETSVLARVGAAREFDLGHALRWAAKARNISMLRLALDIGRRQLGRQKITAKDYFHFGLHLAKFSASDRATFIGNVAASRLNRAIADPAVAVVWRDKVATAQALQAAGLPTPPIRALFALAGRPGPYLALTPEGPTIVELNSSPKHGGHHQTNDLGLLTPAFRAVFTAALAERGITRRGRGMLVP